MLPQLLVLSLALAPNLVSGALFPKNSLVKFIGHKEFKAAMKQNATSVVAFVAPWCGHCQRMAPEYSKAALGLHPLVPFYAVDCDAAPNKRLCADQGVKGFPTVKLFPRGNQKPPIEFDGPQRSASEFYYFAQRGIPNKIKRLPYFEDLDNINDKKIMNKHRALLMKKSNKMPLLWSVLANKYGDDIEFFSHRDRRGKSSVKMGFEAGGDESKVLIYPAGETKPVHFQGLLKHDSLSKFFDSLLDGTANLDELNSAAAAEEFVPDEKELEIERQQEAEMLKLAHGGFANLVDFEAAVKDGSAKNFHGKHGFPGMMDGASVPQKKKTEKDEAKEEDSVSSGSTKSKKIRVPVTDEAGQIVMDVPSSASATPSEKEPEEMKSEKATVSSEQAEAKVEAESEVVSELGADAKSEVEAEAEAETGSPSVVADEKIGAGETTSSPESPAEPSSETSEDHVKDEL